MDEQRDDPSLRLAAVGACPFPLYRVLLERELRLAARFAQPVTAMAIEGIAGSPTQREDILAAGVRRLLDPVAADPNAPNRLYAFFPRAGLPMALVIGERLKRHLQEPHAASEGALLIAGVTFEPATDEPLDADVMQRHLDTVLARARQRGEAVALVYSVRDLLSE